MKLWGTNKLLELKMSVKVIPFGLFQMIAFCSLHTVKDIIYVLKMWRHRRSWEFPSLGLERRI